MAKTTNELAYVDSAGFHLADFEDFLEFNRAAFRRIYGEDIDLDADSQDGQLVTHFAQAQYDLAALCAKTFDSYSPATAVGDALSRQVKINGIRRQGATHSKVDLLIKGAVGTGIINGKVRDAAGYQWSLPAVVTIPAEGEITVTATADDEGPIRAAVGAVSKIATPTEGWISVTNLAEATAGRDVETDAYLRVRQTYSTAQPSQSILRGIYGQIANLPGVTRLRVYENDNHETDANGIPGHTISCVVEGGDATDIAEAIRLRKTTGTGTYGSTVITLTDSKMLPIPIRFYRPTTIHVRVKITLKPLSGYSSTYAGEIQEEVSNYINSLGIGATVYISKLFVPANLEASNHDDAYDVLSVELSQDGGAYQAANVRTAFNAVPYCAADYVSVEVDDGSL